MNFHEIYADLTPSQRDFVNNAYNEANALKDKGGNANDILKDFMNKVQTGGDWDVKNKDGVIGGNITNEYLGNFVYGMAGTIMGIDAEFLMAGAAAQQQMRNNGNDYNGSFDSKLELFKNILKEYRNGKISDITNFDYNPLHYGQGDNPGDSRKILDGINSASEFGFTTNIGLLGAIVGRGFSAIGLESLDQLTHMIENTVDDFRDKLRDKLIEQFPFLEQYIMPNLYDPLALDLDGDGAISVIGANDGSVYFDHDCDGVAFRSSWISSNDGLLVFDRNSNGTIDNGSELFGNFTPKFDGNLATDGFNALSDFDTNNDGIISNLDDKFTNLNLLAS